MPGIGAVPSLNRCVSTTKPTLRVRRIGMVAAGVASLGSTALADINLQWDCGRTEPFESVANGDGEGRENGNLSRRKLNLVGNELACFWREQRSPCDSQGRWVSVEMGVP